MSAPARQVYECFRCGREECASEEWPMLGPFNWQRITSYRDALPRVAPVIVGEMHLCGKCAERVRAIVAVEAAELREQAGEG